MQEGTPLYPLQQFRPRFGSKNLAERFLRDDFYSRRSLLSRLPALEHESGGREMLPISVSPWPLALVRQ